MIKLLAAHQADLSRACKLKFACLGAELRFHAMRTSTKWIIPGARKVNIVPVTFQKGVSTLFLELLRLYPKLTDCRGLFLLWGLCSDPRRFGRHVEGILCFSYKVVGSSLLPLLQIMFLQSTGLCTSKACTNMRNCNQGFSQNTGYPCVCKILCTVPGP